MYFQSKLDTVKKCKKVTVAKYIPKLYYINI